MYSPSHDGNPREGRGTVILRGSSFAKELSYSSPFDVPSSEGLTYISAVLKASSGAWRVEPLGTTATAQDLRDVLADSPELLLRGDAYVYGDKGFGMDVTYLNELEIIGEP